MLPQFFPVFHRQYSQPLAWTSDQPCHFTYVTPHMLISATLIICRLKSEAWNRTGEVQLTRDIGQHKRRPFQIDKKKYGPQSIWKFR